MNILVLQETDWLNRGPNTQHHIFDRLSQNPLLKITIIDYDIDKLQKSKSKIIKKHIFNNINRAVKKSAVRIIRTTHIQIPYLRRISSLISNTIEILKIIKKHRPDIIFAFSITNGFIGLIISKIFKIPFIFYYIDLLHALVPFAIGQPISRKIARLIIKFSDEIIVVTKFLQDFMISEGCMPKKLNLIVNGISLKNTIVNKEKLFALKKKLLISEDDFVVLFMGIVYEFAGLKETIDYYNNDVKSGKYKMKLLILGDSGIYNFLKNYVKEINADWVIITGRIPFFDITEYIELADLCLLSFKLNETTKFITPVKIMEYMAMKKPVLSTNLPCVVNEIGQGNGIIFTKDQVELIKKIGELSYRKKELKKIGELGYNFILKNYLWENLLKDLKVIILKAIRNRK